MREQRIWLDKHGISIRIGGVIWIVTGETYWIKPIWIMLKLKLYRYEV